MSVKEKVANTDWKNPLGTKDIADMLGRNGLQWFGNIAQSDYMAIRHIYTGSVDERYEETLVEESLC